MMITYDWGTTQRKEAAQRESAAQEKINAENNITFDPDFLAFRERLRAKVATLPPEKYHRAIAYYWVRYIKKMLGDDEPDQPTRTRHTAFLIGAAFEGVANG